MAPPLLISRKVQIYFFKNRKFYQNYVFLGKWEEADGAVKEAAEKDPNFAETLINQVMVCGFCL